MANAIPAPILEMLSDAQTVFAENGVDYFIVGAIARDIQLAKAPGQAPTRLTNDVDFAIMVADEAAFNTIKAALVTTGKFTADNVNPLKLMYDNRVEIDLMPFGEIENDAREVRLTRPRTFTMDMPGFREVYPTKEEVQLGKQNYMTCSVEGLILLKLYAWNDRPSRNKDLQDIDLLLNRYIDISDTVYQNHFDILGIYDETEQTYLVSVSGRAVGRELAKLLAYNAEKIKALSTILAKRPMIGWTEMADGLLDKR